MMFFIVHSKRESTRKAIATKGAEETQYSKVEPNFGQIFTFIIPRYRFWSDIHINHTLTQMSLCDSLQIIGHSGLRTKTRERKKSR